MRNFGEQADEKGKLRGQIELRGSSISEPTLYVNDYHYVEVYVVKDEICIAKHSTTVPIGADDI